MSTDRHGRYFVAHNLTEKERARLERAYRAGVPTKALEGRFRISHATINALMKARNVPLRPPIRGEIWA